MTSRTIPSSTWNRVIMQPLTDRHPSTPVDTSHKDFQPTPPVDNSRTEEDFRGGDSCEDTRVPNTPVLAALKPACTSPSEQSPRGSITLDDVEKGECSEISQSSPSKSWLRRHFADEVSREWADVILLLCWFTTGFLDSTIFNSYGTFVSMQTGNTVLLGLGTSNAHSSKHPYRWAKSLTSLIAFLCGCLFFSTYARILGPLRRSTLTASFLFQSLIVVVAASVVHSGVVEGRLDYINNDINWLQEVPIILLSFQAPGQTAGARQLGFFETPTVVVTTMIYDFASDPDLYRPLRANPVRNRRFAGVIAMLMGAIAGGGVTASLGHIHVTLWTVAAIKLSIGLAWIVWPRKEPTREWGQ